MIWICTLSLLAIAAWLFFNALNERRWVQAHSHDETVAIDQGFLPNFTTRTSSGIPGSQGKVTIGQETTPFARAVSKVQDKTSKYGEKFIESRAAAARLDNNGQRPRSAGEENTLFGRAVSRVGDSVGRMDRKLDEKMKAASSQGSSRQEFAGGEDEGLFARATRKVAASSEELTHRVANRARNMAQGYGDGRTASEEEGVFGKMVGKVSGGIDKFEAKVDARVARNRTASGEGEDLVTRVANKVGNKVNEIDEKIVKASKDTVGKFDN